MSLRSIRYRLNEANNIWPGFVDVLATLLIVIIFVLMVFTVSQIYLSDAISGRDKALQNLKNQISELSKILVIEAQDKQLALLDLRETQDSLSKFKDDLKKQTDLSKNLQTNISKQESKLFIQDQNILALSEQIKDLLGELRIVASALEKYEGDSNLVLEIEGLGERINKALASRIDQLNNLNNKLDISNIALADSEAKLKNKIQELQNLNSDLLAINDVLGLDDADLVDQLTAIKNKNQLLETSQLEKQKALDLIDKSNKALVLKDLALQEQIIQYQEITNDLLAINNSLGLQDASLIEQLEAIRSKNTRLSKLNLDLMEKDNTIISLRGKIIELNNILSLSEDKQAQKQMEINNLNKDFSILQSEKKLNSIESANSISEMEIRSQETLKQVSFLSNEIEDLKKEISILNQALESSDNLLLSRELKIEVLGERLNKALTSKVFELQKYRSEFFGKLKEILGDRQDIKIVGDRFIFESELLFDSASADLQSNGMEKLKQIGLTLKDTTNEIPSDVDWIIQVEGHTDNRPIKTLKYPSNWELSTARANSVLKLLLDLGFSPNRLSAAGYGEFYPITKGSEPKNLQQNRRIELKLTAR